MSFDTLSNCDVPSRFGAMLLGEIPNYAARLDEPEIERPIRAKHARKWRLRPLFKRKREVARAQRLEKVLAIGNWLYDAVRSVETNWRKEVLEGKTVYDPRDEALILDYFRQWSAPCERCHQEIMRFQSKTTNIDGADRFLSHCTDAKEILLGHNPFFDEASNVTRWASVTEFLRPKARPVRVDEQGRLFEMSGERFVFPGLEPERVLAAEEQVKHGQFRTLKEVIASRTANGI